MSSVSVSFEWEPLGEIQLDALGRLAFPKAPLRPGLYKFRFVSADQVDVYVGESDQLARRFQHYRTPGPSQRTNLRLREKMMRHLKDGGAVEVQIATDRLTITIGAEARPAYLLDKAERVLLEHASLISERVTGVGILNA